MTACPRFVGWISKSDGPVEAKPALDEHEPLAPFGRGVQIHVPQLRSHGDLHELQHVAQRLVEPAQRRIELRINGGDRNGDPAAGSDPR
jgi:hypothetical protein